MRIQGDLRQLEQLNIFSSFNQVPFAGNTSIIPFLLQTSRSSLNTQCFKQQLRDVLAHS